MVNVGEILSRRDNILDRIEELKVEKRVQDRIREHHKQAVNEIELKIEAKEFEQVLYEKSLAVFKKISDERNSSAKKALETVINWALSKAFTSQSYEVKIEETFDGRSGKMMELYLIDTETGFTRSLKHQTGTALSQMFSFLMMLTVIKFAESSRVVLLDEVFSGLEDEDALLMFSDILTSLAKNEGFQGIMVEQNRLISDNENFVRIYVNLDEYAEGLQVKKVENLKE